MGGVPLVPDVIIVCAAVALFFVVLMVYGMFKGNRRKDKAGK
ncbi:MAG TPA: hypothetical protein VNQ76_00400 [Planctomicrobium sp.]|nr:hypothetical protein [Planctomicrobium sp.]